MSASNRGLDSSSDSPVPPRVIQRQGSHPVGSNAQMPSLNNPQPRFDSVQGLNRNQTQNPVGYAGNADPSLRQSSETNSRFNGAQHQGSNAFPVMNQGNCSL